MASDEEFMTMCARKNRWHSCIAMAAALLLLTMFGVMSCVGSLAEFRLRQKLTDEVFGE